MQITAGEIAEYVQGEILGNGEELIHAPAKIEEATSGTISFLANMKYEPLVYKTKASVLLVSEDFIPIQPINITLIKVKDVYQSLALLLDKFDNKKRQKTGIAESVIIKNGGAVPDSVWIDHHTVIDENVSIGERTQIGSQVYIGKDTKIGDDCIIYPGVKIYNDTHIGHRCVIHANSVIGSDGFGFSKDEKGRYKKIPQIGNVILEEDVEIGANTVIDRATMGSTLVKKGVKLDNLIQIGHNVVLGKNTVIAAQAGISGSTKLGDDCMIGGQVGMAGHLSLAKKTIVLGRSGITKTIKEEGKMVLGNPAIDRKTYLKAFAIFKKLPQIEKMIEKMEATIKELKSKL